MSIHGFIIRDISYPNLRPGRCPDGLSMDMVDDLCVTIEDFGCSRRLMNDYRVDSHSIMLGLTNLDDMPTDYSGYYESTLFGNGGTSRLPKNDKEVRNYSRCVSSPYGNRIGFYGLNDCVRSYFHRVECDVRVLSPIIPCVYIHAYVIGDDEPTVKFYYDDNKPPINLTLRKRMGFEDFIPLLTDLGYTIYHGNKEKVYANDKNNDLKFFYPLYKPSCGSSVYWLGFTLEHLLTKRLPIKIKSTLRDRYPVLNKCITSNRFWTDNSYFLSDEQRIKYATDFLTRYAKKYYGRKTNI